MLFKKCKSCNDIGTWACGPDDSLHFFCNSHFSSYIVPAGGTSVKPALESLSPSEVSSIRDANSDYQLSSICQVIQTRNSRIGNLLQQIRKAEEECSSILKAISSGPIARDVRQVLSYQALPLFSDSSIVRSLLDLKNASDFSSIKILDVLSSLNSSLLSSFPSSFPSPSSSLPTSSASSLPTKSPSLDSVQESSTPRSSSQTDPSPKLSTQTIDRTNYSWELLQQTKVHDWPIFSIAVSDCEQYVASAGIDYTIKVLELQTLCPLLTLEGHKKCVTSIAFLGNKIVSGSEDRTIKIWEEQISVKTLNLHSDAVLSVCVSSCKRLIVSGSADETAVVFRLEDNKTLHTLTHSNQVESVAFSSNDKEIISGGGEWNKSGLVKIWKTETGELLKTLNAHSYVVTCVNFSGKFIASSSIDKTVKIWDRDNAKKSLFSSIHKSLLTFTGHSEAVVSLDIRDNLVASLGLDNRIIVRDLRSGSVLQTLQGHGNYDSRSGFLPMGLKVLEEGKLIVSGGGDGKVKVWRRAN